MGRLAPARPRPVGDDGAELTVALKPRIRRTRKGTFALDIPREERDALRLLPGQLRDLLATDDPALERLFPPAYPDDVQAQADFASLTHDDLRAGKLTSIEVMERTIDADRLDEEQLLAWLGSINDLRLVFGTRLGVTEETDERSFPAEDPRAFAFALYAYLGWLEEQAVEALAAGLDPHGIAGH